MPDSNKSKESKKPVYRRKKPNIIGICIISALFHVAIVGIFIKASANNRPRMSFDERTITTKLIKLGKPRNKKYLPQKKVIQKIAAPQKKAVSLKKNNKKSKKHQEKQKVKEKQVKKTINRTIDLLAAVQKIEELEKKNVNRTPEGSKDGVIDGELSADELERLGNVYMTKIYRRIKSNYLIPSIIGDDEQNKLETIIVIYIDLSGNIFRNDFEKRSGNTHFDAAIESAIKKSSPLPAPPKELREVFLKDGIECSFKPRM